ncbi:alpha/beta hydrolase [Hyunsoonleella ulvae]|uniref:alpha/beta hydrolase n=1 Tax=Hyunsoonleella ulvae TaxID=2799948 RepID=UPI0019396C6E|nr:alpha/beta hydrolase-fold protein [Hyunsoonleella ulvae]
MNIKYILIVLILFSNTSIFGQQGKIFENQIIQSKVLNRGVKYNIYLPPNYDTIKTYPTIYYLHGFGGNNNSLHTKRFIKQIDSLIVKDSFPETIIIAPNGGKSWYIDDYAGKEKYATMFISEFIPEMKKKYVLTESSQKTVVMGLSMGGFGALRFTMLNPEEFGICVSFMGAISTKKQMVEDLEKYYQHFHAHLYGENLSPKERTNEVYINNNALYIAEKVNTKILKSKKWFIQTCDDDFHSLPNAKLHILFHQNKIEHEFRVTNGKHNKICVEDSMLDALEFIKNNLKEKE